MIFCQSDRIFEAAGRDPEKCARLIERLQRARNGLLFVIVGIVLIPVAFVLWACIPAMRWFLFPSSQMPSRPIRFMTCFLHFNLYHSSRYSFCLQATSWV